MEVWRMGSKCMNKILGKAAGANVSFYAKSSNSKSARFCRGRQDKREAFSIEIF